MFITEYAESIYECGNLTNESSWIRSLPWRQKNKPESKSAQIKFAPQLMFSRKYGWKYLELRLVNRSSWTVWVEEANIVLADLRAILQTTAPTGEARYQILQNVGPNETLGLSLAVSINNAAGRPQGRYSSLRMSVTVSSMNGAI